jgi:DNA-binding beta-propeller fold protein YncE
MDRREFLLAGASAAALLTMGPAAIARRLGGVFTILVTADTEAHVAAVELGTGRITRRIPTVEAPRAIESVHAALAVVAHTTEGVVSLLDGVDLRVRKVLRSFAQPRYAAAHPDGRHVYVTDSGNGELVTLDVERARVVHRTDLGGPARHVSISPSGRTLWTALGNKAEAIAVVDTRVASQPHLIDLIRPPYLAHDVVFTPNGSRVWVTSGAEGTIGVYRARSRDLRFTLAADAAPQHIVFGEDVAYVASGDDGTVRVHGLHGGRLVRTEHVPYGSYNVAGVLREGIRSRLFTPSLSQGTLCILDGRGRTVRQVQVASAAHDAAFVVSA